MKKVWLSLLLTLAAALSPVCGTAFAENVVKDVSSYGSWVWKTAYYVPGSSGDESKVKWTETTGRSENDDHTQTAVKVSGAEKVPKGTVAINLGGSLGDVVLKNYKNDGAKTFHSRFTFKESSSPILLKFGYQTSGKADTVKDACIMTNNSVTLGDTTVEATAPYDINIFQNIDTGVTVIYVNNTILLDQRKTGENMLTSTAHHWRRLQFVTTEEDSNFKFVIKRAHHDIYDAKVLLSDVIDYVMLDDKSQAQQTNYLWTINGIKTDRTKIQGAMDGLCTITGDNTNGYVLTPNSINQSHYGYARYFLGHGDKKELAKSTEDKVLWQSFEYSPTNLTKGQIIEVRGNDNYQTLITAVPAKETESAYLLIGGKKVCEINSNEFYKIDLIINNKDYETYILVDGKVAWHDAIWKTRQPLWQTVFSSYDMGESMTLKNMKTTVYDSTVDIYDIISNASDSVYVEAAGLLYDANTKELQVTSTMVGSVDALSDTADIIYAAYNADGALVSVDYKETDNTYMNTADYDRRYPYGFLDLTDAAEGDVLTIKAFLWDSVKGMKPISNVGQSSYTVPAATATE